MVMTLAKYSKMVPIVLCGLLIFGTAAAETVTVLQVIDGDTCVLEDGRRVRYLGIDAPERGDPLFNEATQANNKLVGGKEIRLELSRSRQDKMGRLLAYVFVNKQFVNQELVHQGYAHIRRPLAAKYQDLFLRSQAEARAAGRGIWAKAAEWHIAIAFVHADAEGDDRHNLCDEYIVIENRGNIPLNLTGWTISDEANHRYLFPNFILAAKAQVTLRTGFGKNTENEIFWGSRRPIWNNDGDTIFIKDADGGLVLSYVY